MESLEAILSRAARLQGFILTGFSRLERLESREEFFAQWIAQGRHGEMEWLTREPQQRFDPRRLDPRLCSCISLAYPYQPSVAPRLDWRSELRGRIASYAFGPDYHDVVLEKARVVAEELRVNRPGAIIRVYVDTGPVFEREWAARGGLGWFGRNTNLLNRYHGSYFFLAEILTDVELAPTAEPYREHCGTCRQCLDECPTGALADGYLIEPRICISYLTIEHRGPIPTELRPKIGNWIFGCDVCQEVCPWNGDATRGATPSEELMPRLSELLALDDGGFRRRYGKSAVKRTKRRGLLRNAAVALGNSGNPDAIPLLVNCIESEPEALVRSHAAWALGRLGGSKAFRALESIRTREQDTAVTLEIEQALSNMPA